MTLANSFEKHVGRTVEMGAWLGAAAQNNSDVIGVDNQCETSVLDKCPAFKVWPCYAFWAKARAQSC